MDSAPARGYTSVEAWLAEARAVFSGRIGALLSERPAPDALIGGYIATDDALRLVQSLQAGSAPPPVDPPDLAEAAARLASLPALRRLPVGELIDALDLPADLAPLLALLAIAEIDGRFAPLFAYLNDDAQRRHLTAALAERLAGPWHRGALGWLAADAPLRAMDLVELGHPEGRSLADRSLRLSDHAGRWLTSEARNVGPDPALLGCLRPLPAAPLPALVSDEMRLRLLALVEEPVLVLVGPEESGRAVIAAALAQATGRRHLAVDAAALVARGNAPHLLQLALRDAALGAATLIVTRAECLAAADRDAALARIPTPVILTASERLGLDAPQVALPHSSPARNAALWQLAIGPERDALARSLAHRFRLPPETILAIGAAEAGAGPDRLAAACVERSSGAIEGLAVPIEPRHDWADLILPPRQIGRLRALVARARCAPEVFDGWGFGQKLAPARGLTALFSGPSGAGKTMSAGIVAGELGLPLYRVDLSATVSKYIGETEKNLERLFVAAESGNACLFFDECDALFGKRSEVQDAHDRYANLEISYLLQRLETHRGIVILATNFPQNIDDAFARRIDVTVEFALPDAASRQRLWQGLLPPEAEAEIDAALLGDRFELSGGAIRNCLLTAAFLAADEGRPIGTDHCLRAVAQEYEKIGRPLTRAEFGAAFGGLRPRVGG
jgi:hypothetical protein